MESAADPDAPGDSFFTWDSGGSSADYSFVHTAVELPKYPDGSITEEERQMLLLYMQNGHPDLLLGDPSRSLCTTTATVQDGALCDPAAVRGFLETIVEENSDDLRSPSECDEASVGWGSWDESDDDRVTVVEVTTGQDSATIPDVVKCDIRMVRDRSLTDGLPEQNIFDGLLSGAANLIPNPIGEIDCPPRNPDCDVSVDVNLLSHVEVSATLTSFTQGNADFDSLWISADKLGLSETANTWCGDNLNGTIDADACKIEEAINENVTSPPLLVEPVCLIPSTNVEESSAFDDDFKDYFLPSENYVPFMTHEGDDSATPEPNKDDDGDPIRCIRIGFDNQPDARVDSIQIVNGGDLESVDFAPQAGDVVFGSTWCDNLSLNEPDKVESGAEAGSPTKATDARRTMTTPEFPLDVNQKVARLEHSASDDDESKVVNSSLSRWQHCADLQHVGEVDTPTDRWQHRSESDYESDDGLPPQLKHIYSSFKMKDKKMSRIRIKEDKNNNFKTLGLWDNETKVTLPPFNPERPGTRSNPEAVVSKGDLDDLELDMFAVSNSKSTDAEIDDALKSFNHLNDYSSNSDESSDSEVARKTTENIKQNNAVSLPSDLSNTQTVKRELKSESENSCSDNSDNCPLCTDPRFKNSKINDIFQRPVVSQDFVGSNVQALLLNTFPKISKAPHHKSDSALDREFASEKKKELLSPVTSSDSDEGVINMKDIKKRMKKRNKDDLCNKHDDSGYVEDDEDDDEDDILDEKEKPDELYLQGKSPIPKVYNSKPDLLVDASELSSASPSTFCTTELTNRLINDDEIKSLLKDDDKQPFEEKLSHFSKWLLDKELLKINSRDQVEKLLVNDIMSLKEQTIAQFLQSMDKSDLSKLPENNCKIESDNSEKPEPEIGLQLETQPIRTNDSENQMDTRSDDSDEKQPHSAEELDEEYYSYNFNKKVSEMFQPSDSVIDKSMTCGPVDQKILTTNSEPPSERDKSTHASSDFPVNCDSQPKVDTHVGVSPEQPQQMDINEPGAEGSSPNRAKDSEAISDVAPSVGGGENPPTGSDPMTPAICVESGNEADAHLGEEARVDDSGGACSSASGDVAASTLATDSASDSARAGDVSQADARTPDAVVPTPVEDINDAAETRESLDLFKEEVSNSEADIFRRVEYKRSKSAGRDPSREEEEESPFAGSQSKSTPDLRRCHEHSSVPLSALLSKSVSQRIQDYLGHSARGGRLHRSLPPGERSRHYRRICVSTETVVERAARFEARSRGTSADGYSPSRSGSCPPPKMRGNVATPATWRNYNKPTAAVKPTLQDSRRTIEDDAKPKVDRFELITGYAEATKVRHKPPLPPPTNDASSFKSACVRGKIASARRNFFERLSHGDLRAAATAEDDSGPGLDRFDHFRRSAREERARLAASHPDLGALEAAVRSSRRRPQIDPLSKKSPAPPDAGPQSSRSAMPGSTSSSSQGLPPPACLPYRRCTGEIAWASCSERLREAQAKRHRLVGAVEIVEEASSFKRPAERGRVRAQRRGVEEDEGLTQSSSSSSNGGESATAVDDFLGPRARSMDFLLDAENREKAEPPENRLGSGQGRVKSEHELRVERSLQNLTIPDWYKQSAWSKKPKEGFILRRGSEGSAGETRKRWQGFSSSRTPSATSLTTPSSQRNIVMPKRVTPTSTEWRYVGCSLMSSRESLTPASPASLSPRECSAAAAAFQYGLNSSLSRWSSSRLSTSSAPLTTWNVQRSSYRQPYLGWRAAMASSGHTPSSVGSRSSPGMSPMTASTPVQGSRPGSPRRTSQEHHATYAMPHNQITSGATLRPEGQEASDGSRISPLALYDNTTNVFFNSNVEVPVPQPAYSSSYDGGVSKYAPELRRDRYSYTQSLYAGTVVVSPGGGDPAPRFPEEEQQFQRQGRMHSRSPQPPPRVWMESSFVGTKKNGSGEPQVPAPRSIRIVPSDADKAKGGAGSTTARAAYTTQTAMGEYVSRDLRRFAITL